MHWLDITAYFLDIWNIFMSVVTIVTTVFTDYKNTSRCIIHFKRKNSFTGFKVIKSEDELSRRAIAWFYRNFSMPNISDWNFFLSIFRIDKIPIHTLQYYDLNNKPTNSFITIYHISNDSIHYSYNNVFITIPARMGYLLPDQYIPNIEEFNKKDY